MEFILIGTGALIVLGIIAALTSRGDNDEIVTNKDNCASCTSKEECKLSCMMEEALKNKN